MREDYGKDEIQLRGMYLQISCDYEFLLADIAFYCSGEPSETKDGYIAKTFDKTSMGEKLRMTVLALKKYNHGYYKIYEKQFKVVERLTALRNKYAHSNMKSNPEKDDGTIDFLYYKKGKLVAEKKNKAELYKEMNVYIYNIYDLAGLWSLLKGEASTL